MFCVYDHRWYIHFTAYTIAYTQNLCINEWKSQTTTALHSHGHNTKKKTHESSTHSRSCCARGTISFYTRSQEALRSVYGEIARKTLPEMRWAPYDTNIHIEREHAAAAAADGERPRPVRHMPKKPVDIYACFFPSSLPSFLLLLWNSFRFDAETRKYTIHTKYVHLYHMGWIPVVSSANTNITECPLLTLIRFWVTRR